MELARIPKKHEDLDPVLERMMEAVHPHDGTVNTVMGRRHHGFFGAPLAPRTTRCGLLCGIENARIRDGAHAATPCPSRRVGLNLRVVVRSIGNDLHMYLSAIGQPHTASRMEQMVAGYWCC